MMYVCELFAAWGMGRGAWSMGQRARGMGRGAWSMGQRARSVELIAIRLIHFNLRAFLKFVIFLLRTTN